MTMTFEQIAELCHETYRTCCRLGGDESQPPWSELTGPQTASIMHCVEWHFDHRGTHWPLIGNGDDQLLLIIALVNCLRHRIRMKGTS